jgi:hypothetical protein
MTASDPPSTIDATTRRALAAALYNHAWDLMAIDHRTDEQIDELIHAAHASRHHWGELAADEPWRLARGEWLCSRVYAVLGRAEPSLWHARRCLGILEATGPGEDWDLPAAYEAMARAHVVAGDFDVAREWKTRGIAAAAAIADAEDRETIEADLATIPV